MKESISFFLYYKIKEQRQMPYEFIFRVDDHTVFQARLHNEQCAAHTKTGERCKRRVIIGLDLCYSHLLSLKHLRIKPSTIPEAGRGLFARNPKVAKDAIIFKTGDVIADYIGETLTAIQLRQRYHGHTAPYTIQLSVGKNPPATSVYEDCALVRGYAALCNQALRKREQNARLRLEHSRSHSRLEHSRLEQSRPELRPKKVKPCFLFFVFCKAKQTGPPSMTWFTWAWAARSRQTTSTWFFSHAM